MLRNLAKIIWLSVLVVAGSVGIWIYQEQISASHKIAELEAQKKQLDESVQRLSTEKRVADICTAPACRNALECRRESSRGREAPPAEGG